MNLDDSKRNYALKFAGSVIGRQLMTHDVSDDICMRIADALSRTEELITAARDQWGGWDWQYSDAQRRGQCADDDS